MSLNSVPLVQTLSFPRIKIFHLLITCWSHTVSPALEIPIISLGVCLKCKSLTTVKSTYIDMTSVIYPTVEFVKKDISFFFLFTYLNVSLWFFAFAWQSNLPDSQFSMFSFVILNWLGLVGTLSIQQWFFQVQTKLSSLGGSYHTEACIHRARNQTIEFFIFSYFKLKLSSNLSMIMFSFWRHNSILISMGFNQLSLLSSF